MSSRRARSESSTRGGGEVLVDSHLWAEFLSGEKSESTAELVRLIRTGRVILAGPVLFEVLVGPRHEAEKQYLQGRLRAFRLLPATEHVWLEAIELGRLDAVARHKVPFSDVLIAAHVQVHGCALYTHDPHFDVFPRLRRHRLT